MSSRQLPPSKSKDDPFLGSWSLVPELAQYEFGQPPQGGTYRIEASGEGYLIAMEWLAAEGTAHQLSYPAIPDGKEYPYENPAVADTVSMTRIDRQTLDSTSKKSGRIIGYAHRVLSDDGLAMTVYQSGTAPDGQDFTNVATYKKQ